MVSVTDTKGITRDTSATRNARLISLTDEAKTIRAEVAAWIDANPDPDVLLASEETYAKRLFVAGATERAEWCTECGETFKPGQPVFRRMVVYPRSTYLFTRKSVAPVCEACRCPKYDRHYDQNSVCNLYEAFNGPCVGCGRPVHQGSLRHRRYDYCSTRCLDDFKREAHILEMAQRRFDCETCGEEYEPKRSDSHYCSSPCRQKAYRERNPR